MITYIIIGIVTYIILVLLVIAFMKGRDTRHWDG